VRERERERTHCLAKSLWGTLNRLCFPSGESIQVTNTELASLNMTSKVLEVSDVAVDLLIQTQFDPPTLGDLYLSAVFIFPLRRRRRRVSGMGDCASGILWLYITRTGKDADEPRPTFMSVEMLLPFV